MDDARFFHKLERLYDQQLYDSAIESFANHLRTRIYKRYRIRNTTSYLVHYTTLDALLSILQLPGPNNSLFHPLGPISAKQFSVKQHTGGHLRLYDTFYSNDPNEGYYFVNSVKKSNHFRTTYKAFWNFFERRSGLPAYLTSLVRLNDWEDADDLVFWRTYGKDGTGCALVFPINSFHKIGSKNLFCVRYGENKINSCLNTLQSMLESHSQILRAANMTTMNSASEIPKAIANVLSPLVFLHKSNYYSYEKEARIIEVSSDIPEKSLYYQFATSPDSPPKWRHFAELPELGIQELLISESKIILGPTVHAAENIKFVLQKILDQFVPHATKVLTSRISYRN